MSKTTKMVVLINLIASILLAVLIGSAIYAWYVRTNHSESIDITTDGIVLTYEIDEDGQLNVNKYEISNLVFFDEDSSYEGKYFNPMAHMIQIDIQNKSKKKVDITLSFLEDTTLGSTDPYATCIISDADDLDSSSETGSVADYISTNSLEREMTELNVAKDSVATFYVYIYGVQPDDAATNDFLSDTDDNDNVLGATYTLTLQIEAVISAGQNSTIVEDNE